MVLVGWLEMTRRQTADGLEVFSLLLLLFSFHSLSLYFCVSVSLSVCCLHQVHCQPPPLRLSAQIMPPIRVLLWVPRIPATPPVKHSLTFSVNLYCGTLMCLTKHGALLLLPIIVIKPTCLGL